MAAVGNNDSTKCITIRRENVKWTLFQISRNSVYKVISKERNLICRVEAKSPEYGNYSRGLDGCTINKMN